MKTKKYLLVNVLMLGFTISLWVQGTLPENTPDWLMLGNQVAIGGAFSFILLTVWLAMHASITAQAFQARLLTQLVRLPIPTWEELEAARTYGSSYEKVEGRQMFRIPFAMGSQENLVSRQGSAQPLSETTTASDATAIGPDYGATQPTVRADVPVDPWGLESSGDSVELSWPYNKECAELRHIQLVRQASQFWQSYDAFARISMSIGANQLMLALSYYILGYVLVQTRSPGAAFAGVAALVGLTQVIAILDMTLPQAHRFIITCLTIAGPGFSCVACYQWGNQFGVVGERFARGLAPGAFLSHGMLVLFLSYSCRVRETRGGGLLPLAFNHLLYLDVFGWTSRWHKEEEPAAAPALTSSSAGPEAPAQVPANPVASAKSVASPRASAQEDSSPRAEPHRDVNYYALEYLDIARQTTVDPEWLLAGLPEGCEETDDESDHVAASTTARTVERHTGGPALQTVSYDAETGQAMSVGTKDFAPPRAEKDLRNRPGAPREGDFVSSTAAPKTFFDSTSFYPDFGSDPMCRLRSMVEKIDPVVSGHDYELPGRIPWKVFMFGTLLLGSVWIIAGVYQLLDAYGQMSWFTRFEIDTVTAGTLFSNITAQDASEPTTASFLQSWAVSAGSDAEELDVSFPWAHLSSQGLSCDVSGRHFSMTDGLSTFVGEVSSGRSLKVRQQSVDRSNRPTSVRFHEVARCAPVLGEAVQDRAWPRPRTLQSRVAAVR
jgi:hypothetical protein